MFESIKFRFQIVRVISKKNNAQPLFNKIWKSQNKWIRISKGKEWKKLLEERKRINKQRGNKERGLTNKEDTKKED